jgi:hypothetical protein
LPLFLRLVYWVLKVFQQCGIVCVLRNLFNHNTHVSVERVSYSFWGSWIMLLWFVECNAGYVIIHVVQTNIKYLCTVSCTILYIRRKPSICVMHLCLLINKTQTYHWRLTGAVTISIVLKHNKRHHIINKFILHDFMFH